MTQKNPALVLFSRHARHSQSFIYISQALPTIPSARIRRLKSRDGFSARPEQIAVTRMLKFGSVWVSSLLISGCDQGNRKATGSSVSADAA